LVDRNDILEELNRFKDKNVIKAISGIRRCGKSTIFELFQNTLKETGIKSEQIVTVNLENGDFRDLRTSRILYEYIESKLLNDSKYYIFLDEIQQVENFQECVDWLYVKKNVDLYITGSNAFLLSGDLATLLSGRYVEIKMQPLSFKEYVSAFPENNNLNVLYRNYIENSSFPGTLELEQKKDIRTYLEGIYNTVLIKDIITNKRISDPAMLQSVIEFIFDNIGNLCSTTKISNTMTSSGRKISVPTVESYLSALIDSFIAYKVSRYDIKGKQYLSSGVKYYVADIGLRYYLLGTKQTDVGHILENVVYLELLRRGHEVFIGKVGDGEVDFIAIDENGKSYYQVAYTVMDENTLKRELSALEAIKDHNPKYLLTMDYMPLTSYNGIKQLNVLEWLLGK